MALTMHRLSREYVYWDVTTENDILNATAEVALLMSGIDPVEIDWVAATILGDLTTGFTIRLLVSGTGNGGDIELAAGDFQAWIRITDTPERPVRRPGVVTVE